MENAAKCSRESTGTITVANQRSGVASADLNALQVQQELVKKANSKEAYDEIAEQIFELREKRKQAAMDTVQRDEQISRITDLQDFIKAQTADLTEFEDALVKR